MNNLTEIVKTDTPAYGHGTTLADIWLETPRLRADYNGATFPQANDLDKVIDIVRLTSRGTRHGSKARFVKAFGFDARQADYYANAAIFIGAIEKSSAGHYRTTGLGDAIARTDSDVRALAMIARRVLASPSFNDACAELLDTGKMPSVERIEEQIRDNCYHGYQTVSDTTAKRRASTVRSWLVRMDEAL